MTENVRQALTMMNIARHALEYAGRHAAQGRRDLASPCAELARLGAGHAARQADGAHSVARSCRDAAKGAARLRELIDHHPEDRAIPSLSIILAAQIQEARKALETTAH